MINKDLAHCGQRGKAPCDIWQMTLNPHEAQQEDFRHRREALAKMAKAEEINEN